VEVAADIVHVDGEISLLKDEAKDTIFDVQAEICVVLRREFKFMLGAERVELRFAVVAVLLDEVLQVVAEGFHVPVIVVELGLVCLFRRLTYHMTTLPTRAL
jgi:hypothetical protein